MNGGLIARRYATVLFQYGNEKGKVDEICADATLIRNSFKDCPEALEFLASPLKKASEKKELLASVFDGKVSSLTSEFLSFTVDKDRVDLLDEILRVFIGLYKSAKGIHTAEITTAKDIAIDKQNDFVSILENKLGNKVEATFKSDESIIGGIIIRVDGKQIDCSVARQLADIEKSLTV